MHTSKRRKLIEDSFEKQKFQPNEFELGLKLLCNSEESKVLSPVSILYSLFILIQDRNYKPLKHIFPESSEEDIESYFSTILDFVSKQPKEIHIATGLFTREGTTSDCIYKDKSIVKMMEFATISDALEMINIFVKKATKEQITEIGNITPIQDCPSILLNVSSWKWKRTNWKYQPNTLSIEELDFFVDDSIKKVSFLQNKSVLRRKYFVDDELEVCTLPHKNPDLSLTIFLPRNRGSFKTLRSTLTAARIQTLLDSTTTTHLTLTVPKIKFETEWNFNEHLPSLGIGEIISHSSPDVDHPQHSLCKTSIIHKTAIETDEEGTTDTVCGVRQRCVKSLIPPIDFIANHPFIFVVTLNGRCLFMGQFCG